MFGITSSGLMANTLKLGLRLLGTRGIQGHSKVLAVTTMKGMRVRVVSALEDNYMYLIIDEKTKNAAAVDPVDAEAMVRAAREEDATITTVLTTHHHSDHAGGNNKFLKSIPARVFGGDSRIQGLTDKISDGFTMKVGELKVESLSTPCHTTGHMCYLITDPSKNTAVFTGDTMFIGGCGKFFEGTAEQMWTAFKKLGKLPDSTRVYCGHEYTTNNLRFAEHVEPDNPAVIEKLKWAELSRSSQVPTVPSTIGEEKTYNPFMRVGVPSLQKFCGCKDEITTMQHLRDLKNKFKSKQQLPPPPIERGTPSILPSTPPTSTPTSSTPTLSVTSTTPESASAVSTATPTSHHAANPIHQQILTPNRENIPSSTTPSSTPPAPPTVPPATP